VRFVRAYELGSGAGAASPGDTAYFALRELLADFRQHHCAPASLGSTLARRLTRRRQREFLSHLPRGMAAYIRSSLTASRQ